MSDVREQKLLRAIIRVIASDEFTTSEVNAFAELLDEGSFQEAIRPLLSHLGSSPSGKISSPASNRAESKKLVVPEYDKSNSEHVSHNQMFDIVKRRKINRDSLLTILSDIDYKLQDAFAPSMTIREILRLSHDHMDERDWVLLKKVVSGEIKPDSYLNEILKSR